MTIMSSISQQRPVEVTLTNLNIDVDLPVPEPVLYGLPDLPLPEWKPRVDPDADYHADQLMCLALNVYHEARGSTIDDQIDTSYVVLNRVKADRFPDTVCEVVYDPYQFSWTHDNISDIPHEEDAWALSQVVAEAVYKGLAFDFTEGRTHYHTTRINPYWSSYANDHVVIGAHVYLTTR